MTHSDTQTAGSTPGAGAATAPTDTSTTPPTEPSRGPADELVEEDLLVEDVSIDGMCGVY